VKDLLCYRNIVGVTADNALRLHVLLNSSDKLNRGTKRRCWSSAVVRTAKQQR